MSRLEDVDNAIWVDPDFARLDPDSKLVYLWSFTNPSCNMSGLYKIDVAEISFRTRLPAKRIGRALKELADAQFLFLVDEVLWVRSRVKHLRSRSPQMAISIARDLAKIRPAHPLKIEFLSEYGSDKWLRESLLARESRTTRIGSADPIGNLSEKPDSKADPDRVSGGSRDPQGQGQGHGLRQGQGSSSVKANLPDDFPRELTEHIRGVWRVLNDLAVRQNAKAIKPRSLAEVVTARAHKPVVRAAHDFAAWAEGQARPRKDVLAGYRNWLDRTDDLAGYELLDENGRPAGAMSGEQEKRERTSRRLAAFDRIIDQGKATP